MMSFLGNHSKNVVRKKHTVDLPLPVAPMTLPVRGKVS